MYIKIDNPCQLEASKNYLSQTPLDQWGKYKNQIMASSAIIGGEKALKILNDTITKMLNMEGISPVDKSTYDKLERQWEKAFVDLNEKILLQKFDW